MPVLRLVLVTHPVRGARSFARALVAARLAACVNLVPLGSLYRWQGRIESAREVLLVIKTAAGRLAALERHVRAAHPYDTPEFVVLRPERVAARYLAWVLSATDAEEPIAPSRNRGTGRKRARREGRSPPRR